MDTCKIQSDTLYVKKQKKEDNDDSDDSSDDQLSVTGRIARGTTGCPRTIPRWRRRLWMPRA